MMSPKLPEGADTLIVVLPSPDGRKKTQRQGYVHPQGAPSVPISEQRTNNSQRILPTTAWGATPVIYLRTLIYCFPSPTGGVDDDDAAAAATELQQTSQILRGLRRRKRGWPCNSPFISPPATCRLPTQPHSCERRHKIVVVAAPVNHSKKLAWRPAIRGSGSNSLSTCHTD